MKTALVLSGGGVRGSWQIGCMEGLLTQGKLNDVTSVYGTSVGAINAALMAYCPEKMLDLWRNVKGRSDILAFNWSMLVFRAQGVFNLGPMAKSLKKYCQGEPKYDAYACYTDLVEGDVHYASNRDLGLDLFLKYVQASAAIPFAMSPVESYVDGGTREMTPLKKAINDGAEKIIVVLAAPYHTNPVEWKMRTGFLSFFHIGYRGLDMLEHEVYVNDIDHAVICNGLPGYRKIQIELYAPDRLWVDVLDFDPKKINAAVDAGLADSKMPPIFSV